MRRRLSNLRGMRASSAVVIGVLALLTVPAAYSQDSQCVPAPAGLVAWGPGDGTAADIQSGHNGSLVDGATFADGLVAGAFSFDGLGDLVSIGTPANLAFTTATSLSIDAWINTPTPATTSLIVGQAHLTQLHLIAGSARLRFATQTPSGSLVGFDSNNPIPPSTWVFVAVTYDAAAQVGRLYIDGTLDNEVPLSSFLTFGVGPTGPWEIGGFSGYGGFFNGLIDEIEIFNRALSPAEIAAIYDAGSAGKCKDEDGDGFRPPDDCDESNDSVNPDAVELSGNFVDENCDGDLGACNPCLSWRNHGEYVRCVAHDVDSLVSSGAITQEQGDALVGSAAASDVGKKGFVPAECN